MPDYGTILYAVEGKTAKITLNRPEKRNALNDELVGELKRSLTSAASDPGVRVVVIEGAGKDFCSGADLAALQRSAGATVEQNLANARWMGDLFVALRRHPRPVVAAVRGRALAGGCGLATACDIILAAESAKFGYPEVNIGFIPAMVMAILRRSVSEKRAFEMITGGEILPAHEALEIGLINHVYPDERFDQQVQAFSDRLASKSASAITLSKNLLYHMDGMTFESAIESGVHLNTIARMTEDCKHGVEQFLTK
ncbi:MAG TPA: enoyl-CoA hydratase-related protein [Blastocatellia bacterium]|nr:enoyl-CoA hydratase-related protein [Blastocatellia bacterium]